LPKELKKMKKKSFNFLTYFHLSCLTNQIGYFGVGKHFFDGNPAKIFWKFSGMVIFFKKLFLTSGPGEGKNFEVFFFFSFTFFPPPPFFGI